MALKGSVWMMVCLESVCISKLGDLLSRQSSPPILLWDRVFCYCSCCIQQTSLRRFFCLGLPPIFCDTTVITDVWLHTGLWEPFEDLNSGPHARQASTLLTEPPSQPQATFPEMSREHGQGFVVLACVFTVLKTESRTSSRNRLVAYSWGSYSPSAFCFLYSILFSK